MTGPTVNPVPSAPSNRPAGPAPAAPGHQNALTRYLRESWVELVKKVTWPTSKQTFDLTVVVCSVCIVLALCLGGIDQLFVMLTTALAKS